MPALDQVPRPTSEGSKAWDQQHGCHMLLPGTSFGHPDRLSHSGFMYILHRVQKDMWCPPTTRHPELPSALSRQRSTGSPETVSAGISGKVIVLSAQNSRQKGPLKPSRPCRSLRIRHTSPRGPWRQHLCSLRGTLQLIKGFRVPTPEPCLLSLLKAARPPRTECGVREAAGTHAGRLGLHQAEEETSYWGGLGTTHASPSSS